MVANTNSMSVLAADEGEKSLKVFHASALASAVVFPVAVLADSGGGVQALCNWTAAGLIPLHGYIGANWIISDYVPKASQNTVRGLTLAASVLAFGGLVKLNVANDGIIDTVKHLFKPLEVEAAAEAAQ